MIGQLKPWRDVIGAARTRITAGYTMRPVMVTECRMVLTLAKGGNGLLNVRCRCMAGTVNSPSERYYNYDALGTARTIPEARALWNAHVSSKGEDHGEQHEAG